MGAEDRPPAYDSIFKELAAKKAGSNGVADYTKGAAEVYSKKASGFIGMCMCGVCCGILGIALPVTEIVIGSLFLYQCKAKILIPIYLIAFGALGVLMSGAGTIARILKRKHIQDSEAAEETNGRGKRIGLHVSQFMSIVVLVWMIIGSKWVFEERECATTDGLMVNSTNVDCFTKDPNFSESSFYCQRLLYDFAYYELIAKWCVIALMLCIGLLVCCCACCAFCCMAGKMKQESTEMAAGSTNKSYS